MPNANMLDRVRTVLRGVGTVGPLAPIGLDTQVYPLVRLEVARLGEHLAAALKLAHIVSTDYSVVGEATSHFAVVLLEVSVHLATNVTAVQAAGEGTPEEAKVVRPSNVLIQTVVVLAMAGTLGTLPRGEALVHGANMLRQYVTAKKVM